MTCANSVFVDASSVHEFCFLSLLLFGFRIVGYPKVVLKRIFNLHPPLFVWQLHWETFQDKLNLVWIVMVNRSWYCRVNHKNSNGTKWIPEIESVIKLVRYLIVKVLMSYCKYLWLFDAFKNCCMESFGIQHTMVLILGLLQIHHNLSISSSISYHDQFSHDWHSHVTALCRTFLLQEKQMKSEVYKARPAL